MNAFMNLFHDWSLAIFGLLTSCTAFLVRRVLTNGTEIRLLEQSLRQQNNVLMAALNRTDVELREVRRDIKSLLQRQ